MNEQSRYEARTRRRAGHVAQLVVLALLAVGCGERNADAPRGEPTLARTPGRDSVANHRADPLTGPVSDPVASPNESGSDPIEAEPRTRADEVEAAPGEPTEGGADEEAPPEGASPVIRCEVPALPIPRPRACRRGADYPDCKWQVPLAPRSGGRYRRWRNTIVEHMWGRPTLVGFVLAAADRFHAEVPEQPLAIGDLDAPGPRHRTHDRGVDVDLYLPGAMIVENAGGGQLPSNYEGKSEAEVRDLRHRVLVLAQALAECSAGQLRIYYDDPVVRDEFNAWYRAQGYAANPFGEVAMQIYERNNLHEFHFHVTIPEDLPLLPQAPLADGEEHPESPILAPPPPGSAANLSSMFSMSANAMSADPAGTSP